MDDPRGAGPHTPYLSRGGRKSPRCTARPAGMLAGRRPPDSGGRRPPVGSTSLPKVVANNVMPTSQNIVISWLDQESATNGRLVQLTADNDAPLRLLLHQYL